MIRPNRQRTSRKRQLGLTMVEVMVAVAVGLLLTAGAIQIFVSSKQAYRTTDAMSRVQENGRYALHFLAQDIRSASFWGCAQDIEVNNVVTGGGFDFDGEPIEGTEGASGAPDTITLRKASQNDGISVNKQMPNTAANLFLTETDGIQEGDIMIVTDCESADIFMVTGNNVNNANVQHNSGNTHNGVSNTTQQFSKSYGVGAMAFGASERTYSIGSDNGNPVLQRTINGGAPQVLVDHVENLQITYGVDTDNDETVNTYVPADIVDASLDWADVLAVRISVTVRSVEQNVAEDDGSGDGRMRKTFVRTLGVRNRLK